jgi:hypothetical protein
MSEHLFHTRRQWHNVSVWAIVSLILLLIGLVFAARSGNWILLAYIGGAVIIGMVINYLQDRADDVTYFIGNGVLRLESRKEKLELRRADIRDASLLDRTAARNYIREKLAIAEGAGLDRDAAKARERAYVRFCTVDIGLRSMTFGIGRQFVDSMPNAKNDLLLLRLSNGEDLLLSPEYNQTLIERIGRMVHLD